MFAYVSTDFFFFFSVFLFYRQKICHYMGYVDSREGVFPT